MSIRPTFWIYLLIMAGVTYLVRMLPLILVSLECNPEIPAFPGEEY